MGVTSLPVPAVVGIRMVGRPRFGMRLMPKYAPMGPLFVSMTAAVFVISMGLPPPRPMSIWACEFSGGQDAIGHDFIAGIGLHPVEDGIFDFGCLQ